MSASTLRQGIRVIKDTMVWLIPKVPQAEVGKNTKIAVITVKKGDRGRFSVSFF